MFHIVGGAIDIIQAEGLPPGKMSILITIRIAATICTRARPSQPDIDTLHRPPVSGASSGSLLASKPGSFLPSAEESSLRGPTEPALKARPRRKEAAFFPKRHPPRTARPRHRHGEGIARILRGPLNPAPARGATYTKADYVEKNEFQSTRPVTRCGLILPFQSPSHRGGSAPRPLVPALFALGLASRGPRSIDRGILADGRPVRG